VNRKESGNDAQHDGTSILISTLLQEIERPHSINLVKEHLLNKKPTGESSYQIQRIEETSGNSCLKPETFSNIQEMLEKASVSKTRENEQANPQNQYLYL